MNFVAATTFRRVIPACVLQNSPAKHINYLLMVVAVEAEVYYRSKEYAGKNR
jgi:hypothetical protein